MISFEALKKNNPKIPEALLKDIHSNENIRNSIIQGAFLTAQNELHMNVNRLQPFDTYTVAGAKKKGIWDIIRGIWFFEYNEDRTKFTLKSRKTPMLKRTVHGAKLTSERMNVLFTLCRMIEGGTHECT